MIYFMKKRGTVVIQTFGVEQCCSRLDENTDRWIEDTFGARAFDNLVDRFQESPNESLCMDYIVSWDAQSNLAGSFDGCLYEE